jgi:hypothetical protein
LGVENNFPACYDVKSIRLSLASFRATVNRTRKPAVSNKFRFFAGDRCFFGFIVNENNIHSSIISLTKVLTCAAGFAFTFAARAKKLALAGKWVDIEYL